MDFCHNPIKKETNLLSLFKNFPDHYTAVAIGYSSKVFFKGYNFQYFSSQPLIFSQMPIKYCPKYFWSTHILAPFFLFASEMEQTSCLPGTMGKWVHLLIDIIKQSDRQCSR